MKKEKTGDKVEHLIQAMPAAACDNRLLLMMYWKVYDGIDIPNGIIKDILKKGTKPETITRSKRKTLHKGETIAQCGKLR